MTPGIIKKLYHTTAVGLTDENKQEVYPITATSAVYSAPGESSFSNMPLDEILDALNEGYQYIGEATPTTNPGTFNHKVFYLASEPGIYSHFDNIEVEGLVALKYNNGSWLKDAFGQLGGSGSAGGYIGTTIVQDSAELQDLTGISNIFLTSGAKIYFGDSAYIELDEYGFHFNQAIYSDSWIAAGGIGSGGSGGGGGASYLNDLLDVTISSAAVNNILIYTSDGWVNSSLKTINGNSLIGSGNITISGGDVTDLSSRVTSLESSVTNITSRLVALERMWIADEDNANTVTLNSTYYSNAWVPGWLSAGGVGTGGEYSITVDSALSATSTNPVQNAVITNALSNKQDTLVSGTNIATINGYNLLNGGNIVISGGGGASTTVLTGAVVGSGEGTVATTVGSIYIGSTLAQDAAAQQGITGITSIKADLASSSSTTSIIEWDSNYNAWHFYGNIYADGWVSAGGVGTDSSSSGGSAVAVEQVLLTGVPIAYITVDGDTKTLYAPDEISVVNNAVTLNANTSKTLATIGSTSITVTVPDFALNSALSGYVTLATDQVITGVKTFQSTIYGEDLELSGNLTLTEDTSVINLGPICLRYDSDNNALHITSNDNSTVNLYADGWVSAGGINQ